MRGAKPVKPYTVINLNKRGEVFDPAGYIVRREDNPELYKFLERYEPHERIRGSDSQIRGSR